MSAPNGISWSERVRIAHDGNSSTSFGASDMTVDGFGRVFVVGVGAGPSGLDSGWRVWASSDGNAPYSFTDLPTDGTGAPSVSFDSLGNVFVSGNYQNADTGQAAARVRRLLTNP